MKTPEVRLYDIRGPPVKSQARGAGSEVYQASLPCLSVGLAWCARGP